MAPANDTPILKGVVAYCHVFLEDGLDVSSAVEKQVKELGGSTTRRIAASSHVFLSSNVDNAIYAEARASQKRLVTSEWLEVCKAIGERVSTACFEPVAPSPPAFNLKKKEKYTSTSAARRRRSNKTSYETLDNEHARLPSPSAKCFSSSQMKDPLLQQEASRRIRGRRRSAAAAKKLRYQRDLSPKIEQAETCSRHQRSINDSVGHELARNSHATPQQSTGEDSMSHEFSAVDGSNDNCKTSLHSSIMVAKRYLAEELDQNHTNLVPMNEDGEKRYMQAQIGDPNDGANITLRAPRASGLTKGKIANPKDVAYKVNGRKLQPEEKVETKKRKPDSAFTTMCSDGWHCARCTFKNRARAKVCDVCLFQREEAPMDPNDAQSNGKTGMASTSSASPPHKTLRHDPSAQARKSRISHKDEKASMRPKLVAATNRKSEFTTSALPSSSLKVRHKGKVEELPLGTHQKQEDAPEPRMLLAVSGVDNDVRSALAAEARKLEKNFLLEGGNVCGISLGPRMLHTDDPSATFTHLLVPKERECRRTLKILFALCTGAHIVTADWLSDSATKETLLPENRYIISRFQRRVNAESRHIATEELVYVGPCETPSHCILARLLVAAGGKQTMSLRDATLVLLQPGLAVAEKWIAETLKRKRTGAWLRALLDDYRVVEPRFLYDGIDAGALAKNRVRRTASLKKK